MIKNDSMQTMHRVFRKWSEEGPDLSMTKYNDPPLSSISSFLPSLLFFELSFFLLPIFPYLFLSSIYPWVSFFPSFLACLLSFFPYLLSSYPFFPSFPFTLVPGESGTAYVKLRDESQVTEFIEVFNGSTVGEDGQDQHTILLSRYDIHKV